MNNYLTLEESNKIIACIDDNFSDKELIEDPTTLFALVSETPKEIIINKINLPLK